MINMNKLKITNNKWEKEKQGYSPVIKSSILESSYHIENGNISEKINSKEEREIYNREGDFAYYSILLESGSLILFINETLLL